jgi:hypothetical protein
MLSGCADVLSLDIQYLGRSLHNDSTVMCRFCAVCAVCWLGVVNLLLIMQRMNNINSDRIVTNTLLITNTLLFLFYVRKLLSFRLQYEERSHTEPR